MNQFILKPVVLFAVYWNSDNFEELKDFLNADELTITKGNDLVAVFPTYSILIKKTNFVVGNDDGTFVAMDKVVFSNRYQQVNDQQEEGQSPIRKVAKKAQKP